MGNPFLADTQKTEVENITCNHIRVSSFSPLNSLSFLFSLRLLIISPSASPPLPLCPLRLWKLYRTWVRPLRAPPHLFPCVTAKPFLCRPSRYTPTSARTPATQMHARGIHSCCHSFSPCYDVLPFNFFSEREKKKKAPFCEKCKSFFKYYWYDA